MKEADDAFLHWIIEREADVTDGDRARARARREDLKTGDLASESYRRVPVAEALKRLASAGRLDTRSMERQYQETSDNVS